MSVKLSPSLKTLLHTPLSHPGPLPAPPSQSLSTLFTRLAQPSTSRGLSLKPFLALSTGALVTLNSPASICNLYDWASSAQGGKGKGVEVAGWIREGGLKSISFSGIPRTINALVALRSHLPDDVKSSLPTDPTRQPTSETLGPTADRGRALWDSIYSPHHVKLLAKLSDAHPDLSTHILSSHYSWLLSDPPSYNPFIADPSETTAPARLGRITTSILAIACLRAQGGVEPQLTSHVFGLRKALEGGSDETGVGEGKEGKEWLTSEEGAEWVIKGVDELMKAVGGGTGSFATGAQGGGQEAQTGGVRAKL